MLGDVSGLEKIYIVCPRRLSMAQKAVRGPESFLAGV